MEKKIRTNATRLNDWSSVTESTPIVNSEIKSLLVAVTRINPEYLPLGKRVDDLTSEEFIALADKIWNDSPKIL